jgi:hypothetical protein
MYWPYAIRIHKIYRVPGRLTAILLRLKNDQFILIAIFPRATDEIFILESKINEILREIPVADRDEVQTIVGFIKNQS